MEKNFYFKHDASAFSNAKLMNGAYTSKGPRGPLGARIYVIQ